MRDEYTSKQQLTSRSLMRNENGKLNGKQIWILMDEQMDFIMEMKMSKQWIR